MRGNPTLQSILPREETPAEISMLVLSSESAAICLQKRVYAARQRRRRTVAVSCDEAVEFADRVFRLAQLARVHHGHLTQGRRLVGVVAPEFGPRTWRERFVAAWQAFVRNNLVADGPSHG